MRMSLNTGDGRTSKSKLIAAQKPSYVFNMKDF